MPKFVLARDIDFFRSISRELVDTIIQTAIVLFKVNTYESKVNIYGESLNKTWYPGVEMYCIIDKEPEGISYEGFGPDSSQTITFKIDKLTCEEKGIYPEIGDMIFFDQSYYEIDNTNEVQFLGGQPDNNYSIVCTAFMTRKSDLNIEQRVK
jgi:hypothetical protein